MMRAGLFAGCLLCLYFLASLQDHFVLPAGLMVLQRVPAVSGLCSQAAAAPAAAPLHHFSSASNGNLPEAAVGPSKTAGGPSQQVSGQVSISRALKVLKKTNPLEPMFCV